MYLTKVYVRPEWLMRFCVLGKGYATGGRVFTSAISEKSFTKNNMKDYTALTKEKSCT